MEKLKKKTQEIIKKAFELWNIKEESVRDIDPIVNLLFSACAGEVINLENLLKENIYKTKDSLIQAFLPAGNVSARPSCGFATALPSEPVININRSFQFNYNTHIAKNVSKELFSLSFKPFLETKIFDLTHKFIYDGNTLISFTDNISIRSEDTNNNSKSIWCGIDLNNTINSIDGLSIFLSFKDSVNIGSYIINEFNFCDNMELFINDEKIHLISGFESGIFKNITYNQDKSLIFDTLSFIDLIKESLSIYEDSFFRIADTSDRSIKKIMKKRYPERFNSFFNESTLETFEDEIIWFEFRFNTIDKSDLEKINVSFNTFPVFNFREVNINLSNEEPIQLIPMKESENLITVTNYTAYNDYHEKIEQVEDNLIPFVIRDMDMEKFSGYDLHEMLDKLLDKFQTDFHAFQENFDVSADDINKLREAMKPIQSKKLSVKNTLTKNRVFAIMNSKGQKDISSIELTCCLTNGLLGNQINSSEKLTSTSSFFIQDSIQFVTKTTGGRDPLTGKEKSNAVRNLILSNNQIITIEDIKSFCIAELGDLITHISVNDSVMKGEFGLRKCILVKIVLDQMLSQDKNLQMTRHNLESKIRRKSNMIVPVMVNLSLAENQTTYLK